MSFSISPSVAFSGIHWDTLQNRPPIDKSMRFCREKDWYRDAKCCMSGYTIEHVRDMAYDHGNQGMPEALFLDGYPCLNGRELDSLVAKVTSKTSGIDIFQGPLLRLFERLFSNSLETALMTPLRGFGPE